MAGLGSALSFGLLSPLGREDLKPTMLYLYASHIVYIVVCFIMTRILLYN